jgi:hypothetical protein
MHEGLRHDAQRALPELKAGRELIDISRAVGPLIPLAEQPGKPFHRFDVKQE